MTTGRCNSAARSTMVCSASGGIAKPSGLFGLQRSKPLAPASMAANTSVVGKAISPVLVCENGIELIFTFLVASV